MAFSASSDLKFPVSPASTAAMYSSIGIVAVICNRPRRPRSRPGSQRERAARSRHHLEHAADAQLPVGSLLSLILNCEPAALRESERSSAAAQVAHCRTFACPASARSVRLDGGCRYHSRTRTVCGKPCDGVPMFLFREGVICGGLAAPSVHASNSIRRVSRFTALFPPGFGSHRHE